MGRDGEGRGDVSALLGKRFRVLERHAQRIVHSHTSRCVVVVHTAATQENTMHVAPRVGERHSPP